MKTNFKITDIEYFLLHKKYTQAQQILEILKPQLTETQFKNISDGIFNCMLSELNKQRQKQYEDTDKKFFAALKQAAKELKI